MSFKKIIHGILIAAVQVAFVFSADSSYANSLESNRELAYAMSGGFIARHEYGSARGFLEKHLVEDTADARAWNTLGLVLIELKIYDASETAFRKAAALAKGEDQAVYLYNAADAANRRKNNTAVLRTLRDAQQASAAAPMGGAVATHIVSIRSAIRAGEPLPELRLGKEEELGSRMSAVFSLKGGYDSNVLLLPDSSNRNPSPNSPFVAPLVQLEFSTPMGKSIFTARSFTSYTAYSAVNAKPYDNLYESAALEFAPPADAKQESRFTFGDRYDLSLLNSNSLQIFSWTDTAYATFNYEINIESTFSAEIPVGYQKFPNIVLLTPADNRNGFLTSPNFFYRHKIGNNSLSFGVSFQKSFAVGNNYKSNAIGVQSGIARPLFWEIGARLGLGITRTFYPVSSTGRADTKYDASLRLSKVMPFQKRMSVSLEDIYGKNYSSVSSAAYHQNTAYLQVNYAF